MGSKTSVYIGCFTREYDVVAGRDPEIDLRYIATGTGSALLSNRLSWFYDFRGPSLTLDSACSSSLNAVHLGCQGLRMGEVSMVGSSVFKLCGLARGISTLTGLYIGYRWGV
jgi:acyl transferase domain-containing protein